MSVTSGIEKHIEFIIVLILVCIVFSLAFSRKFYQILEVQLNMEQPHQSSSAYCTFCNLRKESNNYVYESKTFAAFHDMNPAARLHILIIPKCHIATVKDLTRDHVEMLQEMERIALKVCEQFGVKPESRILGYHVPPFNSIHHLHLHVIGAPFKNLYRKLKYPKSTFLKWFITSDQLISEMKKLKPGQNWRYNNAL